MDLSISKFRVVGWYFSPYPTDIFLYQKMCAAYVQILSGQQVLSRKQTSANIEDMDKIPQKMAFHLGPYRGGSLKG